MTCEAPIPSAPQGRPGDGAGSIHFLVSFALLALLFSIGQNHRTSGGVLSTVYREEFSLSPTLIGVLIGSMFIAQGFGQLPGGVLLDRYGTRRTVAVFSLLAALGCFVAALSTTWHGVLLGRILIGLGFAPSLNGSIKFFLEWTPSESLSTLTGRFLFVGMIGGIVGTGPLSIAVEVYGWRTVYVGIGFFTLLVAVLALCIVRDDPPGRSVDEKRTFETLREVLRGLLHVIRNPEFWPILCVAPFLYCAPQLLVGLWAGPYLADIHQLDPVHRGYALTVMMIGMSIGVLIYGPIETKFRRRKSVVITGALGVSLLWLCLAFWGHSSALVAVGLSTSIILCSTYFVIVIGHAQSLFPKVYSGRTVGVVGLLGVSGVFINQSLTAWLLSFFPGAPGETASLLGYRIMFVVLAVVFLGIAAVYTRTKETPKAV